MVLQVHRFSPGWAIRYRLHTPKSTGFSLAPQGIGAASALPDRAAEERLSEPGQHPLGGSTGCPSAIYPTQMREPPECNGDLPALAFSLSEVNDTDARDITTT